MDLIDVDRAGTVPVVTPRVRRLDASVAPAFKQAVVQSAAVRAQPIALTGIAAMVGAFFILDDPIFNGLAVSLIFGILVSTLLTLVVIPVLYYAAYRRLHETA